MFESCQLWYAAPPTPHGHAALNRGLQGGRLVLADVFHPARSVALRDLEQWMSFAEEREATWPTRYGLRLGTDMAGRVAESYECDRLGLVVLVGEESSSALDAAIEKWSRMGVSLCWEYAFGVGCPVDEALLNGVVVRGYETGGVSRDALTLQSSLFLGIRQNLS